MTKHNGLSYLKIHQLEGGTIVPDIIRNVAFDIHSDFLVSYFIRQILAMLTEKVSLQTVKKRSTLLLNF